MNHMRDDERLLDRLASELEPLVREPDPARVAAVRAHAADAARVRGVKANPWRRRLIVTCAAAALVLVGVSIGVIVADDMPRPVRRVAHGAGLPVDSPELVDAAPSCAGSGTRRVGDASEVRAADAEMVRLVKELDTDERADLEPVAHEVHLRAVEFLEQRSS